MIQGKKIGIWGFGVVGKAAIPYLLTKTSQLQILDKKTLSDQDCEFLAQYSIPFYEQQHHLETFLAENDLILASPGIDVRPYAAWRHKFITELDLLRTEFKKTIIAITGSVGKTSITSILSQLYSSQKESRIYTGGNIGDGMLRLAVEAHSYDHALLEVSSFQLERCRNFAPDLAIFTNFYPNHLDRHGTMQDYFEAKFQIIARQQKHQQALITANCLPFMVGKKVFSECNVLCDALSPFELNKYQHLPIKRLFFIKDDHVFLQESGELLLLFDLTSLPPLTFKQNWLIIISTLYLAHRFLAMPDYLAHIAQLAQMIRVPEHRLEFVASCNGVSIFNDSKATTPTSTLAAVDALCDKPITLLLGGLSKGVNRQPFIQQLSGKVARIVCFGKEAEQLRRWCQKVQIEAYSFERLEEAVTHALRSTYDGTGHILFSPAGSSFDLFRDYQERGAYFKQLVAASAAQLQAAAQGLIL